MPEISFLLGNPNEARNDNHIRLTKAFRDHGWRVTELPHECLQIRGGKLMLGDHLPTRFDLVWPLGLGRLATFFDRMQLLRHLDRNQLVNAPDAFFYLHGKYQWLEYMPETHAGNDVATLARIISAGGDWVVKPPAGSYGRDVRLIREGDDPWPVLQHVGAGSEGLYVVVQRYVPAVVSGEKRTVVAGGQIIGSYLRVPTTDLRANLSAQGGAMTTDLERHEARLVEELATALLCAGAAFAAVDTVGGYLMEVNVANPGGLETMETLYGADFAFEAVAAIIAWRSRSAPG
jgi:glutathione synthase/RimK-type ligase-like ATP-grasp enzyme